MDLGKGQPIDTRFGGEHGTLEARTLKPSPPQGMGLRIACDPFFRPGGWGWGNPIKGDAPRFGFMEIRRKFAGNSPKFHRNFPLNQ